MNSSGKILLGVVAGIAAGALLGIVFAPDKGSKTRRKILDQGEDYLDELKEKFNGFLETVTDKFESIHDEAEDMVSKEKTKYEGVKKEVKNGSM